MPTIDYFQLLESYHDNRNTIRELVASILLGLTDEHLIELLGKGHCNAFLEDLGRRYPFLSLLYVLDERGVQVSPDFFPGKGAFSWEGKGRDRSRRPYFVLVRQSEGIALTEPYLSTATHRLCLSAAGRVSLEGGTVYLVLDVDLADLISYLKGDRRRRRIEPYFRAVYGLIALGLFGAAAALLLFAIQELGQILPLEEARAHLKPLSAIIDLTLALAVFDLGKTLLEEEVLLHKDIFRHSSTRRTITRFTAAILIAVAIEALLMMFKGSIKGDPALLWAAVWMMAAAVALLLGLGIYVYLGCRAEATIVAMRRREL